MPISQQELANQNPWWQNRDAIYNDFKIKQFNESQVQYFHPIVYQKYEPFSLFIIRGARQIGKSTALKLLVQKLLSDGNNPFSIFFFDCEMLFTAIEIKATLEAYFNFIDLMQYSGITYLFLDEITSVTDWTKIIKFLVDSGRFHKSVVFLTGSNAIDLLKGADRLPGRKGYGSEWVMLPLSFREYVKPGDAEFYEKIASFTPESFSLPAIYKSCTSLLPYSERLNKLINAYLIRGVHEKWNNIFQNSLNLIQNLSECGKLMEQLVGNHLLRLPSDYFGDSLGFFSNKNEIDFLLLLNNDIYPIEVKFQQSISELDFLPFKKLGFHRGIVLTKETFISRDNFIALPISHFLSILDA